MDMSSDPGALAHPSPSRIPSSVDEFFRAAGIPQDVALVTEIMTSPTRAQILALMHDHQTLTVDELYLLTGGPATFNADLSELVSAGLVRSRVDHRYPLPGSSRLFHDADRDNEVLDTWIDHYRVVGL